jgi:hypothetical protein
MNDTQKLQFLFKLVNTMSADSFASRMNKPWKFAKGSENITAIQGKVTQELVKAVDMFLKWNDFEDIYSYLDAVQKDLGIKLSKSNKKGLVCDIDVKMYSEVYDFAVSKNYSFRQYGIADDVQFYSSELMFAMLKYLLFKDTVENGSGNSSLDKVISELIDTKPVDFFERGFLHDLFVNDRLSLLNNDSKAKYLVSRKEHISTYLYETYQEASANLLNYDVFEIA